MMTMMVQRKRRQRSEQLHLQPMTKTKATIITTTTRINSDADLPASIIQDDHFNVCTNKIIQCSTPLTYMRQPVRLLSKNDNRQSSRVVTSAATGTTISHYFFQLILSLVVSPRMHCLVVYVSFLQLLPSIDTFTIPTNSIGRQPRHAIKIIQSPSWFLPTTKYAQQSTTRVFMSQSSDYLPFPDVTTAPAISTDDTTTELTTTAVDTNNWLNSTITTTNATNQPSVSFIVSPTPDIIIQQPYDQVQNIDGSYSVRYVSDDGLQIYQEDAVIAGSDSSNEFIQPVVATAAVALDTSTIEQGPPILTPIVLPNTPQSLNRITETSAFTSIIPRSGFNVVLTHCTADFDSLASAVGLAKLWSSNNNVAMNHDSDPMNSRSSNSTVQNKSFDSASHVPTYVVLPRGAHPGVQRFLGLHKHLFPIRSLKSILSSDHISSLNRLALVDAQRRDRLGPAEPLLQHANRITIVDHHVDQDSDIMANDYVMDQVGSVSTIIVERLQQAMISSPGTIQLTEAEATLLALGIHADTGNLCFDSTTVRDAYALAWCISQGASQTAIAEHGQSSLSAEQQGVLTQALVNVNSTVVHGVTIATVLLQADGFINGLAAVTQDAMELSSSDIFLLGLVYHAKSGSGSRKSKKGTLLTTHLLSKDSIISPSSAVTTYDEAAMVLYAEAWQGGEEALRRRRLRVAFDRTDIDGSGYLDESEISASLASSGVMSLPDNATSELIKEIDTDGDGKIDFEEFIAFATEAEKRQRELNSRLGRKGTTMIIIGRVKAGVNMKSVKLNKLLEQFGGGGHAKAASATVRLNDESEAEGILQSLVDELISTNLQEQPTVGDFMTSPVLSVSAHMTEKQVEDMFTRYDVRAFPVVDDSNDVVGLVSYQLTVAAQQRLRNKELKRLRQEIDLQEKGISPVDEKVVLERSKGSAVKGWMIQNVRIVEESKTLAEVEAIFLENDIGCIPVVADGTKRLVGMVTRTDLLRQHRYYPSLAYHNKGFADSIAARKPIIELRKKLKQFDLD